MKSFKQYITEAKKDLPKGNPGGMTAGDIEQFKSATPGQRPKNLSTDYDTSSRRVRRRSSSTVKQTPVNQYIRGQQEKGIRVSQELTDTAGVRSAAERGDIKPVQAGGETKPSPGATNRARARGAAARQGVDISAPESKLKPRGQRLGDTTKGGPVKVIKPTQPAPAPKPETVKKPVPTLSRRGALSKQVDPILKDLRSQGVSQRALQSRMSAAVDKTRAADKALADKATEALKQIRADSKPPTTTELIKQTQQKPPTGPKTPTTPKPPTASKPTLPTFASKGQTSLPGVETPRPGVRTYRGSAALVNKPAPVTAADVTRTTRRAVTNTTKRAAIDTARKLKTGLRVAGVVGAGLEAAGEFKRRKDMGQDTATAAAGSGTRTVGGAVGAKLAAGTAAKVLSPLAVAPFPGARPLYALGVGAAGVGGYTLGADWATKGFDYAKQNFKGFQDKANKAYQRLLLPQYRTKTEEFVPEEAEFTVEFVQRLKDFTAPVRNNPTVKAVTNNPYVRGAGRALGGLERAILGGTRAVALYNTISPDTRPSEKVNSAISAFSPPGISYLSTAISPSISNSKFIRKNIDEPIMRTNKKIDQAVGQHPKPGSGKTPNYARLYRDMQTRGMPMF